MFLYSDEIKVVVETLDKYDFSKVIQECRSQDNRDPSYLQDAAIPAAFPELESVLEDLTTDEFMDYIQDRYNVRFTEITTYGFWCIENEVRRKEITEYVKT